MQSTFPRLVTDEVVRRVRGPKTVNEAWGDVPWGDEATAPVSRPLANVSTDDLLAELERRASK